MTFSLSFKAINTIRDQKSKYQFIFLEMYYNVIMYFSPLNLLVYCTKT